ncbi:MAG TPA: hypothetical protein VHP83_22075 [Aggregatilineaceae bacterium]|nr:hypothetical protein [Aggregatilineaceae bacterium]
MSDADREIEFTEPPLQEEDTRPKAATAPLQPIQPLDDTAEIVVVRPRGRVLLPLLVMAIMVCLCLLMASMAGIAGYRDGLATNDVKHTREAASQIAEQYRLGSTELAEGNFMAVQRFEWIVEVTKAPTQYALDSAAKLAQARTMQASRPTRTALPSLTPTSAGTTPPTLTITATVAPTAEMTATPNASPTTDMLSPAYLYSQAEAAMRLSSYEEAIEWLDALIGVAPDHRRAEVDAMLLEALEKQGGYYMNGTNDPRTTEDDSEDMLRRGVDFIYRASDIGPVDDLLLGQAYFVESYINARAYVNGGQYEAALPILQNLCDQNCAWSYHGVSVQMLLDTATDGG